MCVLGWVTPPAAQITKKHDKTVANLLQLCALPRVRANLVQTFMSKVDTQPFLRILNNERYGVVLLKGEMC